MLISFEFERFGKIFAYCYKRYLGIARRDVCTRRMRFDRAK